MFLRGAADNPDYEFCGSEDVSWVLGTGCLGAMMPEQLFYFFYLFPADIDLLILRVLNSPLR